jgi:hypothetical protein
MTVGLLIGLMSLLMVVAVYFWLVRKPNEAKEK